MSLHAKEWNGHQGSEQGGGLLSQSRATVFLLRNCTFLPGGYTFQSDGKSRGGEGIVGEGEHLTIV